MKRKSSLQRFTEALKLQTILETLRQPVRDNRDIPQRIEFCHQALAFLTPTDHDHTHVWIATQEELGANHLANPFGNRADNIELAIEAFQELLTVATKEAFPTVWAGTQHNLATAYSERTKESVAANLERAIQGYEEALKVFSRVDMPNDWSLSMMSLANCLQDRLEGDKAENVERAIDIYYQVLEVYTQASHPEDWAMLMHNLGNAYMVRVKGKRVESIEQAMQAYHNALEVRTKQKQPVKWALTMNALASAYWRSDVGDRSENVERAIEAYQAVLTVRTPTHTPYDWAITMLNLGRVYAERIQGSRAENLEKTIECLKQALTVLTSSDTPEDWAGAKHNLALAYANRIRGEKSQNIEIAIALLNEALTVFTFSAFPAEWAMTLNSLGLAYKNRIIGDRAENIEIAITSYQQSLFVRTRTEMPEEWCITLTNLGSAYLDRLKGEKAKNIEFAIGAYEQVLLIDTRETSAKDWALVLNNLGNAYKRRVEGDKSENIERAISAYLQVLTVRTESTDPLGWASTIYNLGSAYLDRVKGDKAENIELAIACFERGSTIETREASPYEWANIMNSLGNAYRIRVKGENAVNISNAVTAYRAALTFITDTHSPMQHRDILWNLMTLYCVEKQWDDAYQTCLKALEVVNKIYLTAYGDAGRQAILTEMGQLQNCAGYCAVQLGLLGEALIHIESAKARLLQESITLSDENLNNFPLSIARKITELRETILRLEHEYRIYSGKPDQRAETAVSDELGVARATLRELIAQARGIDVEISNMTLGTEQILSLIPKDSALVAPLFVDYGSVIFIIPYGTKTVTQDHVILLQNFTLRDFNALVLGDSENPGWLRILGRYRTGIIVKEEFFALLDNFASRLWITITNKIYEKVCLLPVHHLLFLSLGGLYNLPIHASWHETDQGRKYLLDEYLVTFTPSMAMFAHGQQRNDLGSGAIVAGVSEYRTMPNLTNARREAASIATMLNAELLLDQEVSLQALQDLAVGKAFIHLCCHGGFGWKQDLFDASLVLGNDEILSLPTIMAKFRLQHARLVVLSACETGMAYLHSVTEEFVGLTAGFLQTGARSVVSSLWTVDDFGTSLLMELMYKFHLQDNITLAAALCKAQVWMRDATTSEIAEYYKEKIVSDMDADAAMTAYVAISLRCEPTGKPFESPYYWAAFTYNGLL